MLDGVVRFSKLN